LGEANGTISFHEDNEDGVASRLTEVVEIRVPVVRLDSVLRGTGPTYIKLDVEGAELSVLKGATETLAQHKLGFVVCLYHKAEDIWEIPYWFIQNTEPDSYKYYVRIHSSGLDSHCLYLVQIKKRYLLSTRACRSPRPSPHVLNPLLSGLLMATACSGPLYRQPARGHLAHTAQIHELSSMT
jgi:hypothetical protein